MANFHAILFAVPITLPQVSCNFTKLHFLDAKIILDNTGVLFLAKKSETSKIFALKGENLYHFLIVYQIRQTELQSTILDKQLISLNLRQITT